MNIIKKFFLGIDVGGTNIKSALVDTYGKTTFFQSIATKKEKGPEYVLRQIENIISLYKKKIEEDTFLAGVGMAIPGAVDRKSGTCLYSPNLQWDNINISQRLKKSTGCKIDIINDANASCIGEYFFGAGVGYGNLICITIGTGIGSAFIIDHKLFVGVSGLAGEAGHIVVKIDGPSCSCGQKGCLETLISATAIVSRTREKIHAGYQTQITKMIDGQLDLLTTEIIIEAYRKGDSLAIDIISDTKKYLVIGLVNLVNLFNPERIVLGGGVIKAKDVLLDGIEPKVKESIFPTFGKRLDIVTASLEEKAGVVGAASILFKEIQLIGSN